MTVKRGGKERKEDAYVHPLKEGKKGNREKKRERSFLSHLAA